MSYRFRNRGEKSQSQKVYEWVSSNDVGTEFHMHDIAKATGISNQNVSSALNYLMKIEMIEKLPVKKYFRDISSHPLTIYKYVKNQDKRENSKPIDYVRPQRIVKKRKVVIDTKKVNITKLRNMIGKVLECAVELEEFLHEIEEANNGQVQTSVRPASELQVWD